MLGCGNRSPNVLYEWFGFGWASVFYLYDTIYTPLSIWLRPATMRQPCSHLMGISLILCRLVLTAINRSSLCIYHFFAKRFFCCFVAFLYIYILLNVYYFLFSVYYTLYGIPYTRFLHFHSHITWHLFLQFNLSLRFFLCVLGDEGYFGGGVRSKMSALFCCGYFFIVFGTIIFFSFLFFLLNLFSSN